MSGDPLNLLLVELRSINFPEPVYEHRFHPTRRWRFDLAWPALMLAVEIDGGTWTGGRHVSPVGFARDCEKCAEAAILGWVVIRVTPDMIRRGVAVDLLGRYRESMLVKDRVK